MATKQPPRRLAHPGVQGQVLTQSRRRCALCFHLFGDGGVKKGQIAHLDHRRSRSILDNLVYLCFEHHDDYDSTASQRKNYTIAEVRAARTALYEWVGKTKPSASVLPSRGASRGKSQNDPTTSAQGRQPRAVVVYRRGNIFEVGSDLTVLPCSARGHFSKTAEVHITRFGLPLPPEQPLGSITVHPFPGTGTVTRYIAWAASVMAYQSTAEIVREIGQQLGQYANANTHIHFIEAPLLGTGAGELDELVAGLALREGFLATCVTDATMTIYALSSGLIRQLRSAVNDSRAGRSGPTSSLS